MKSVLPMVCSLLITSAAPAATLLFDFGADDRDTAGNWNNVLHTTAALAIVVDDVGNTLPGVGLQFVDRFFENVAPSQLGTEAPTGDASAYPVSATDDYLFGHTGSFAGESDNSITQFKLLGLSPGAAYSFTFFASRTGVNDNREARYTVTGATSGSVLLNPSNNDSEVARVSLIEPNESNEILVRVEAGPGNDNGSRFYYLGVMQVDTRPIPEPSAPLMIATFSMIALLRRSRQAT